MTAAAGMSGAVTTPVPPIGQWPRVDPLVAFRGQGVLAAFNRLAVLAPADLHVAGRLCRLAHESDESVRLAVALTVRGLRLGHVCVDLATISHTVSSDLDPAIDLTSLCWPETRSWLGQVSASSLVWVGDDGPAKRPIRLVGTSLYLDRYWCEEVQVAADLAERSSQPIDAVDMDCLRDGLGRLFPDEERDPARRYESGGPEGSSPVNLPRLVAAVAVLQRVTVIAGGPGTGKTTTVARILGLLEEQASATDRPTRIALAAPTGKAATRLEEAVHDEARRMAVGADVTARLLGQHATTLHRLLGWRPDSQSRFRHDRRNHLPHDTVVVDETSMVSLSMMAKLTEALRPSTRLILVGDPDQLASVEAGAVLGDIVGPVSRRLQINGGVRARLAAVTGQPVPADDPPPGTTIGDGIVVLKQVHRFGGDLARLAETIQRGDAAGTLDVLQNPGPSGPVSGAPGPSGPMSGAPGPALQWLKPSRAAGGSGLSLPADGLSVVRGQVLSAGRVLVEAAEQGDGLRALRALGSVRVLCAHRLGPSGVAAWTERVAEWLRLGIAGYGLGGPWYVGRPVLVTENDYELELFNGDTGVVVRDIDGTVTAVFPRRGELYRVGPSRLGAVQTLHATTIHKGQGSQFDAVVVVLPDADSSVLTRELLYTAVTRARHRVTLVGSEESIIAAVERPIARASGLRRRLWG